MKLEICVDTLDSAIIAQKAGADRIELCADLSVGGTTPSCGLIKLVKKYLTIPVYVMIRPRSGDFCYSTYEVETMKEDIKNAKLLGVDGVVFGVLRPSGGIDGLVMKELVELASPMKVTVHRAFDMSKNLFDSLEILKRLGVERILTSSGSNKATDNLELIKLLKENAENVIIMPGSGINAGNVKEVIKKTGVKEIHMSGKKQIESMMQYKKEGISMGNASAEDEYKLDIADFNTIAEVKKILNNI